MKWSLFSDMGFPLRESYGVLDPFKHATYCL